MLNADIRAHGGTGKPEFAEITRSPNGLAYGIVSRFKGWGTQTSSSGILATLGHWWHFYTP
jgi:hypothetical protein